MINRILPAYYFTLECIFLYFLLYFFYIYRGNIPSALSFLAIIFVAYFVLHIGLKRKTTTGIVPFIGALLSGLAAYLLDFTPMSVLMCFVFIFIRMTAFLKDSSLWKKERPKLAIFFYCSSVFLLLVAWMFNYPKMNWIYGIVLVFTIGISFGTYLQNLEGKQLNRNVLDFAAILGIAGVLTWGITLLTPVVNWLFKNIFEGIAIVIGVLLKPLFIFTELNKFEPGKVTIEDLDDPAEESSVKDKIIETVQQIPSWIWLALLALLLIYFWYNARKIKMEDSSREEEKQVNLNINYIPSAVKIGNGGRFFRDQDPHEYVRKLFFHFQLFAEDHGLGRYEHETIREWFERVGFQKDEDLFLAYECVRYGGKVIHKQDAKHYEMMLHHIKLEVKERFKKNKGREA